jgi:hypothetical protein
MEKQRTYSNPDPHGFIQKVVHLLDAIRGTSISFTDIFDITIASYGPAIVTLI